MRASQSNANRPLPQSKSVNRCVLLLLLLFSISLFADKEDEEVDLSHLTTLPKLPEGNLTHLINNWPEFADATHKQYLIPGESFTVILKTTVFNDRQAAKVERIHADMCKSLDTWHRINDDKIREARAKMKKYKSKAGDYKRKISRLEGNRESILIEAERDVTQIMTSEQRQVWFAYRYWYHVNDEFRGFLMSEERELRTQDICMDSAKGVRGRFAEAEFVDDDPRLRHVFDSVELHILNQDERLEYRNDVRQASISENKRNRKKRKNKVTNIKSASE